MSSETLWRNLSLSRTALAALLRRRSGSPIDPLPKSNAQTVPVFAITFLFGLWLTLAERKFGGKKQAKSKRTRFKRGWNHKRPRQVAPAGGIKRSGRVPRRCLGNEIAVSTGPARSYAKQTGNQPRWLPVFFCFDGQGQSFMESARLHCITARQARRKAPACV